MSLFPAYFGSRKRPDEDLAPSTEPENESRVDIFNLIPPRASDKYERPKGLETPAKTEIIEPPAKVEGRNIHPTTAMDLTRLTSAIQATATMSNWACRTGLTQCDAPAAPAPRPRPDIPA
jgi:hypothetical protein